MNKYELMVLFKVDSKGADIKADIDKVLKKIEEKKGNITKKDDWGIKELSFVMKKQSQAYYYIVWFEMEEEALESLKLWLQRSDFVLRSLASKVD